MTQPATTAKEENNVNLHFRKGQVIFREGPYATAVDSERLGDTCNWCFSRKATKPLKCSTCSKVSYCSTRCRHKDSTYHAFECSFLQAGLDDENGAPRFTLRTLARILEEEKSCFPSVGDFFGHPRIFEDLMSHAEDWPEDRLAECRETTDKVARFLAERGHEVSADFILEVRQKLLINGHGAEEFVGNDYLFLGQVVYLGASKSDHTCELRDEYVQVFDGNHTVFKALKDFTILNPSALCCHYMPLHYSFNIRQEVLLRKYYFTCKCTRCMFELFEPSYACFDALENLFHSAMTPEVAVILASLESRFESAPNKNFYKHMLMTKIFMECSHASAERAYRLGMAALEGCVHHHDRMRIMFKLCKSLADFGANRAPHDYFNEFQDIQRATLEFFTDVHGEGHPAVQQVAAMAAPEITNLTALKLGTPAISET